MSCRYLSYLKRVTMNHVHRSLTVCRCHIYQCHTLFDACVMTDAYAYVSWLMLMLTCHDWCLCLRVMTVAYAYVSWLLLMLAYHDWCLCMHTWTWMTYTHIIVYVSVIETKRRMVSEADACTHEDECEWHTCVHKCHLYTKGHWCIASICMRARPWMML